MIIARIARDVRGHFIVRAHEWFFALVFAAMGLQLSVFPEGAPSPLARALMHIMPMGLWATCFLVLSASRMVALTLNGTFAWFRRWSPLVRSAIAFVSGMIWLMQAGAELRALPAGSQIGQMIVDYGKTRDACRGRP